MERIHRCRRLPCAKRKPYCGGCASVGDVLVTARRTAMLGSTVLEVAIGLTFCFGTVALIVSTLQEALASLFRLRANTLLAGVKSMLNDPRFTGLARAVYAHPLVNPHTDGNAIAERELRTKPSYIEPAHFAIALVDSLWKVPGDFIQLRSAIDTIPDPQVK